MKSSNERRPLSPEELESVKKGLVHMRTEIWKEILDDLDDGVKEQHKDILQTMGDEADIALEELRKSTIFSLIDIKSHEIKQIDLALKRIAEERYGKCLDCGKWIRPARLEIMPYAVRCRKCQEKLEKDEKTRST